MNIREVPKNKLLVLGFCAAAMLFMSACVYRVEEETKEPEITAAARVEITAAVIVPEKTENSLENIAQVETDDTAEPAEAFKPVRSANKSQKPSSCSLTYGYFPDLR